VLPSANVSVPQLGVSAASELVWSVAEPPLEVSILPRPVLPLHGPVVPKPASSVSLRV
jgi:hypothetical protein